MAECERTEEFENLGAEFDENEYKFLEIDTDKLVACKKLSLRPIKASLPDHSVAEFGIPCATIREVSLLRSMEHENIARLLSIEHDKAGRFVRLVFEYPGMDLNKFFRAEPVKAGDLKLIKSLLYQLLSGISYQHSVKAAHGNLNHKNVLIDCTNNTLKITHLQVNITDTITYKAPELFLGASESSLAADMFSIGCIFAEMVTQKPLFPHPGNGAELSSIFNLLGTPTEENWPGSGQLYDQLHQYNTVKPADLSEEFPSLEEAGVDLLSKLLCLDPSKRITAIDALKHEYFKDVQDYIVVS